MNEKDLIKLIREAMTEHEKNYGPDVWADWTYHDVANDIDDKPYTKREIEKIWYQIVLAESDGVVDAVGDTHLKEINLNKSNGLTQINKQYTDEGSELDKNFVLWHHNQENKDVLPIPFKTAQLLSDPVYNLKAGMMLAQWFASAEKGVNSAPNPFNHWATFNKRKTDDTLVEKWSNSSISYNMVKATLDNEMLVGEEGFGLRYGNEPDQAGGIGFSRAERSLNPNIQYPEQMSQTTEVQYPNSIEPHFMQGGLPSEQGGLPSEQGGFTPNFMQDLPTEEMGFPSSNPELPMTPPQVGGIIGATQNMVQ